MLNAHARASLERDGFAVLENLLDADHVQSLITWSESLPTDDSAVARRGAAFARRNLLDDQTVRAVAENPRVRAVVEAVLSADAFAVRAILFDKTPDANWTVPWHQDRSIAVRARADVEGFGPWSEKAGVVHVQPPIRVLQSMITVRIHLDTCGADNGPLRVVAGTQNSLLDAATVDDIVKSREQTLCTTGAGGAVVMRPLILHASSPARNALHRRVIHIEYASTKLPGDLAWRFDA